MPFHSIQYNVIPCYTIHTMPRMPCYLIPYHTMSTMSCYAMLFFAMPCQRSFAMSFFVMTYNRVRVMVNHP